MTRLAIPLIVLTLSSALACSDTPTSPTETTTTSGPDSFSSTLAVGGTATRTFTVAGPGTVQATLSSTTPADLSLGFMIGVPKASGTGCLPTLSVTTAASAEPQLAIVADPGTFCAQVYDVGTLRDPISFSVTIAHP